MRTSGYSPRREYIKLTVFIAAMTALSIFITVSVDGPDPAHAETMPSETVASVQPVAAVAAQAPVRAVEAVATVRPETPEPTPTPEWEPLADVPLDAELQRHIHDACELYGVDMALVLGIIETESTFDQEAESLGCWGLMQIHEINYGWLRGEGIDPLTYPGNIEAGVLMIGRLLEKYQDTHKALMAYNCGESGARGLWEQGYTTSAYSRGVIKAAECWETILSSK